MGKKRILKEKRGQMGSTVKIVLWILFFILAGVGIFFLLNKVFSGV